MTKKLTALGGNIFSGLFTVGVQQAGFEVLGHLEHGPYGVATARLNFPKLEIRVGREHWKEQDYKNKVDFMYCNPPCAAWSVTGVGASRRAVDKGGGGWEGQLDRLRYVYDLVEAGIAIRPKAWAWESVTGAWGVGQSFVREQAEKWNDAGYHVTVLLQDNQFLGAAQVRKRMFFIAHLHPLVWPKLTATTTVAQALATLKGRKGPPATTSPKPLSPLWERLWKRSENHNFHLRPALEADGRGPKNLAGGIPMGMCRRLRSDQPAPVMISSNHRLHPTEPRFLNWQEWLALCGLPPDWKTTVGGFDSATSELARAVLPPVGRWLATAVKDGLKLPALNRRKPVTRVVDLRKPDERTDELVFAFEGFTMKPTVPPPLPLLSERPPPRPGKPRLTPTGEPRKPGSGLRIRAMLLEGLAPDAILKVIHAEFPGSKATKSDVSWNRGRLRRDGQLTEGDKLKTVAHLGQAGKAMIPMLTKTIKLSAKEQKTLAREIKTQAPPSRAMKMAMKRYQKDVASAPFEVVPLPPTTTKRKGR